MESDSDEIISFTPTSFDLSSEHSILMHDKASNNDEYAHEEAVPLQFAQHSCQTDVIFLTDLSDTKMFRMLFDYVKKKASSMYY